MRNHRLILSCLAGVGLMATSASAIGTYDAIDLIPGTVFETSAVNSAQFNLTSPGSDTWNFDLLYGPGAGTVTDLAYGDAAPLPVLTSAELMVWVSNDAETQETLLIKLIGIGGNLVVKVPTGGQNAQYRFSLTDVLSLSNQIQTGTLSFYLTGVTETMRLDGVALGVTYESTSVPEAGSTLAILGLALLGIHGLRRRRA